MLNNRIFLLEMHAVLISCFSGSIRASSVTEVGLLYSATQDTEHRVIRRYKMTQMKPKSFIYTFSRIEEQM